MRFPLVLLYATACHARQHQHVSDRRPQSELRAVEPSGQKPDVVDAGHAAHKGLPGHVASVRGELRPTVRWTLGLALLLLSCALSSGGTVMQRKACLADGMGGAPQRKEAQPRKGQQRFGALWVLGVAVYVAAAAPDVLAYTLLPHGLCSAAGCLRVAVVAVAAHFLLGERLGWQELLGIATCVLGTGCVLAFGPGCDEPTAAPPGELHHPKVWTYLVFGLAVLTVVLLLEHADAFGVGRGASEWYRCFTLPFATALAYGLEKVLNTELGFLEMPRDYLPTDPHWFKASAAVAALGLLDFYLNLRGVRLMAVQVFVPITFALGVLVQYFQSVVVLDEFAWMSRRDVAFSALGAALLLAGALCIQAPLARKVPLDGGERQSQGAEERET